MDTVWLLLWSALSAAALFALVRYTHVGDWIIDWMLADYGLPSTRLSFGEQAGFALMWVLLVSIHALWLQVFLPFKTALAIQCVIALATLYLSLWYIRNRFPIKE